MRFAGLELDKLAEHTCRPSWWTSAPCSRAGREAVRYGLSFVRQNAADWQPGEGQGCPGRLALEHQVRSLLGPGWWSMRVICRVRGLSFPVVVMLYGALVTSAVLIIEYGLVSKFHVDANTFYPFRRDLVLHALAFTGLTLPALCLFRPKLPVLVRLPRLRGDAGSGAVFQPGPGAVAGRRRRRCGGHCAGRSFSTRCSSRWCRWCWPRLRASGPPESRLMSDLGLELRPWPRRCGWRC